MGELVFVALPNDPQSLDASAKHWMPFLSDISKRSKEPIDSLLALVARREVLPALVWDKEEKVARALIGIRRCQRGDEMIGEIVWLTGVGMLQWRDLLPQLEKFLVHLGCSAIRPVARPGWWKFLKPKGYQLTHYVLEKRLAHE